MDESPNHNTEEENVKKKTSVHLVFVIVHSILAVVTLIPMASASKASLLGYKSHCSFTPISTLILLALAGLHIMLHRRQAAAAPTKQ